MPLNLDIHSLKTLFTKTMWMLTCRMVDLLSTLHKETTLTSDPTGIFRSLVRFVLLCLF